MENALPRREARENAFLLAFSATFGDQAIDDLLIQNREGDEHVVDAFGEQLLRMYYNHSAEVDDLIRDRLRNWTMQRLPRVTLAVLRLGVAELVLSAEKKPGVVINEAVELSKKYGAEEDYQFVNGLMGSVARDLNLPSDESAADGQNAGGEAAPEKPEEPQE
jgi:N utilization substance protein B